MCGGEIQLLAVRILKLLGEPAHEEKPAIEGIFVPAMCLCPLASGGGLVSWILRILRQDLPAVRQDQPPNTSVSGSPN